MNLRSLLTANAVVGLIGGLGLLAAPGVVASTLGLALDDTGLVLARLYGAELLGFNVAGWMGRDVGAGSRRALVIGHAVNETATAVVLALALASGLGNIVVAGLFVVAASFAIAFVMAGIRNTEGKGA
ncbi:MAG: hypothetical protein HY264_08910 [Chloroflexi bacterium]|nr:hypothetical protein [Chloroflexota bacterium]